MLKASDGRIKESIEGFTIRLAYDTFATISFKLLESRNVINHNFFCTQPLWGMKDGCIGRAQTSENFHAEEEEKNIFGHKYPGSYTGIFQPTITGK